MPAPSSGKKSARPRTKPGSSEAAEPKEGEAAAGAPVYLIHGDDDFLVQEEAKRIIQRLSPPSSSEFSLEVIEGGAGNQAEAAAVFKKLYEMLQSQSFFASEKIVWLKNTNLLGANATASSAFVSENMESLAELLKKGLPAGTVLVITATEVDGRKSMAKTLQKIGEVTAFKTDPYKERENMAQGADFAVATAREAGKKLTHDAAMRVVELAMNDSRTIQCEVNKAATYVGEANVIGEEDIQAIGSQRPGGVVWDLPDAVGNRELQRALDCLGNLLFLGETPIGLIATLINRMRLLLLLSELRDLKLLRHSPDYAGFKGQLDRLPSWVKESLPEDKRSNPLAGHPFALWKASSGMARYSTRELIAAFETLLEANERLVSSGGDARHILEEAIIRICMKGS
jgi:DNA polymerase III subunit delta